MVIVNPYLNAKKKKSLSQFAAAGGTTRGSMTTTTSMQSGTSTATTTTQQHGRTLPTSSYQKVPVPEHQRPTLNRSDRSMTSTSSSSSTTSPTPTTPSVAPLATDPVVTPSSSYKARDAPSTGIKMPTITTTTATTTTTTTTSHHKKKLSFRAQLKQQIQDLKRRKKLEQERKLMQQRIQEREAVAAKAAAAKAAADEEARRQRQILQAERIRKEELERQKRIQEELQRRQKEEQARAALQEEIRKRNEEETARAKHKIEEERIVNQAIELQQQQQPNQQRFLQYPTFQQHQIMHQYQMYAPNTTSVPFGATSPAATMMPPFHPSSYATPHFYHPAPSVNSLPHGIPVRLTPEASTSDPRLLASQVPVHPSHPQIPTLLPTESQVMPFPYPNHHNHHPPHALHNPIPGTVPVPPTSQTVTSSLVHPPARMVAPPQRMTMPRPPRPKILSFDPIQPPSPFANDFQILEHTFIIVKEQSTDSFGVSVEVRTESILLEPDVWESIQPNTKDKTTRKLLLTSTTPPEEGANHSQDTDTKFEAKETVPGAQTQQSLTALDIPTPDPSNNNAAGVSSDSEPLVESNEVIPVENTLGNPVTTVATSSSVLSMDASNESSIGNEATSIAEPSTDLLETICHPIDHPPPTSEMTSKSPEEPTKEEDVPSNTGTKVDVVNTSSDAVVATNPSHGVSAPACHEDSMDAKLAKRKRRKRAFFHVMSVMDASKQNAKNPEDDSEKLLRQGDLILAINGVKTCGLPFFQACQLFGASRNLEGEPTKNSDTDLEKTFIQCSLLVARRKPKPPPIVVPIAAISKSPSSEVSVVSTIAVVTKAGEFSSDEMMGLADLVNATFAHSGRLLGYNASSEVWLHCLTTSLALTGRDNSSVQKKLVNLQTSIDAIASNAATNFWKNQWKSHYSNVTIPESLKLEFMTLAQLSTARALPRPIRGCRCGSSDHEYVNSPKCILYHSLRTISEKTSAELVPPKKAPLETTLKDLNAIETAFKDRFVKMKEEQENEATEAKFVDEMEKLQIQKHKRAIFAPNFTTMVLCAVAAIGQKFDESLGHLQEHDTPDPCDETDDLDNDDIPLLLLGKRPPVSETIGSPTKKLKNQMEHVSLGFHPAFLAEMLIYIGHTWGHTYREPSHADFTWRWEVHHGQTSATSAKHEKSKNPRTPGLLTLESAEFAFDDQRLGRLKESGKIPSFQDDEQSKAEAKQWAEDMICIAHLVSPNRTGLLDELKALEQTSIIRKTRHQAAVLSKDWYTRVDPLILDDMDMKWSFGADPDNKYLVHNKVKRDLANYWIRVDGAWALNEDLSEIVFVDDEWEEWRRSFEEEKSIFADNQDGIGKFGI